MAKNTICLWYEHDAEKAARFYAPPSMRLCATDLMALEDASSINF